MIPDDTRQAIIALSNKGMKIRLISRTLGLSRNTVRRVLSRGDVHEAEKDGLFEEHLPFIAETYHQCRGNVVRVREILNERDISIGYSILTRLVRDMGIREPQNKRAGAYVFEPGEEMQHDTSPHKVIINGKSFTAQCAGLALSL